MSAKFTQFNTKPFKSHYFFSSITTHFFVTKDIFLPCVVPFHIEILTTPSNIILLVARKRYLIDGIGVAA